MDIVDKISGADTTQRMGHADVPVEPIIIEKAEFV
jgi:cyclophilin family peptidyl-prolyl cis-trans isomerase